MNLDVDLGIVSLFKLNKQTEEHLKGLLFNRFDFFSEKDDDQDFMRGYPIGDYVL